MMTTRRFRAAATSLTLLGLLAGAQRIVAPADDHSRRLRRETQKKLLDNLRRAAAEPAASKTVDASKPAK